MKRLAFVVVLFTVATGAAKDKPAGKGLSPKLQQTIRDVESAYFAGNIERVWKALAPAINGLTDDVAAKFDEELAARKVPSTCELLVDARLKLLMEHRETALPAPSVRERLLILASLHERVQKPLQEATSQTDASPDPPLPKDMEEFDQRFRVINKLRGKLLFAGHCGRYAQDLASKISEAARKKLTDGERDTVALAEADAAAKLQESDRDLRELELELRLLRLRYGVEVLKQKQLTTEKFIAAAITRQDVRILQDALEPPATTPVSRKGANSKSPAKNPQANPPAPVVFRRAVLAAPDLALEVKRLAHDVEEWAGPLGERAERFFAGLEYWLRGRYGWGPEVWGLAKSSAALDNPQLLQLVSMPENLHTPRDHKDAPAAQGTGKRIETKSPPVKEPTLSCLDRRHHYTWAWEDRRLVASSSQQAILHREQAKVYAVIIDEAGHRHSILDLPPSFTMKGHFSATERAWGPSDSWTRELEMRVSVPPQDPRLVYRIVGFIEYARALQCLDQFVKDASTAELKVAEEIIRSQKAFRIETNLSRKIETANSLSERGDNPREDFNRHGLEWMLALARIELGAMLAGFTSHADPFLSLAPTTIRPEREQVKTQPFGAAAFAELLLDGLRTHHASIVSADVIGNYYKTGVPENHLLTYGRRAIVARQLVRAVLQYHGGDNAGVTLTAAQRNELQTWDATFEKLQRIMLYCLTFKVEHSKMSFRDPSTGTSGLTTSLNIERDQAPDGIRRILLTTDPTLAACGCH